jgi:hypothetical protein
MSKNNSLPPPPPPQLRALNPLAPQVELLKTEIGALKNRLGSMSATLLTEMLRKTKAVIVLFRIGKIIQQKKSNEARLSAIFQLLDKDDIKDILAGHHEPSKSVALHLTELVSAIEAFETQHGESIKEHKAWELVLERLASLKRLLHEGN